MTSHHLNMTKIKIPPFYFFRDIPLLSLSRVFFPRYLFFTFKSCACFLQHIGCRLPHLPVQWNLGIDHMPGQGKYLTSEYLTNKYLPRWVLLLRSFSHLIALPMAAFSVHSPSLQCQTETICLRFQSSSMSPMFIHYQMIDFCLGSSVCSQLQPLSYSC